MKNQELYCADCGLPTHGRMADMAICDDCYALRGACCAGDEPEEPQKPSRCAGKLNGAEDRI